MRSADHALATQCCGRWSTKPIRPACAFHRSAPATEETAEIVRLCAEARVPVVPQGGNLATNAGDGNIHFNLTQPEGAGTDAFLARREEFNTLVHDITHRLGGSISAEHGIGSIKRTSTPTA